ncbi:putative pre-16S rRNA nuclease [Sesbania bispinosa]|nr:putative pre-16S rRNA nuclease [Sesbania bispinosa]
MCKKRGKREQQWRGGFTLGVDLGMALTGLALSKGFSILPLTEGLLFELQRGVGEYIYKMNMEQQQKV